jgi:hypothetical protein
MNLSHRRGWLQGVTLGAGSTVLGPTLANLQAHAAGVETKRRRFVFVVEGNGVPPEQVQPTNIKRKKDAQGRNNAAGVETHAFTANDLPPALQPVAKYADRLTVIQGLSGRICGGGHSNNFGALGVYSGKKGPDGETIDCALGRALPSVFGHVGLGIIDKPEAGVVYNVSAYGKGKPAPTQCRPDLAYQALFGSVAGGTAKGQFDAQSNLLDFLAEDVRRVERELAGPEREKLQHYLNAFEGLRDRQVQLSKMDAVLKKHAPPMTDKFASAVETHRLEAHVDLAAASLAAGLTNVVTLASGCGDPYFSVRFHGLGISLDKHSIGHGGGLSGKTSNELSTAIRQFHFQLIARLADKLAALPEGSGTMLDHTTIVYLSDSAESHHSRCWDWPVVVLGGRGGKCVVYPQYGKNGHRTIGNLYATFLHAAGKPLDHFGLLDPNLRDLDQRGILSEVAV